ncbi:MAG: M6 family metalloprotease domain-containing protein [Muribaculaceae bacterium]|nr:M6 family metalloprotease domain-containing protein [Muribaculaceae bacterium]
MKKQVLALTVALGLVGSFTANAVPAKRGLRDIAQPDGTTVKAELVGDENFHYFLSEDGLPLVQKTDGALHYVKLGINGELVYSPMTAENAVRRSSAAKSFTSGVNREAVAEALYKERTQAKAKSPRRTIAQSGMGLFSGNFPRKGDIPALVILVEYKDVKFTHPNPAQYFGDMINKEGFNEYGGTGCAREYFLQQSGGLFRPQFEVFGPVTLPETQAYYGGNDYWGNDMCPEDMLVHAAKILDDEIDFSKYDLDNDGRVDNVFIFYAGQGEASYGAANTVWPHSWELSSGGKAFSLDGKILDRYACTNEWEQSRPDGVGTFIHEFSHVMGLPDLYNTVNGAVNTPDSWSVMDYGPYNNDGCTPPNYSIYERNAMGWIEPKVLDGPDSVILNEIGESNEGCIILTEKPTEFYLLENRQQKGWDQYIPGHGMLIWHIDFVQSVFDRNVVNNSASHQYVDLVEAGGVANSTNPSTLATYSWPGTRNKTSFTSSTSPALKSWAGKAIDVPITEIKEIDGVISFDVCGGQVELTQPTNVMAEGHDNGTASLSWDAVAQAKGYRLNLYTKDASGEAENYALKDYYTTSTEYTAERLASGATYFLTVTAVAGNYTSEESEETEFTMPELAWDYMIPQTMESYATNNLDGFTAYWKKVPGAVSYILDVEVEAGDGEKTDVANFGSNETLELPTGWLWTGSGVYSGVSVGYYGESAPALKFSSTGHSLTTSFFDFPISKVEWWERGASADAGNKLSLQGRADTSSDWEIIYEVNPTLDSKGETVSVTEIPEHVRQLRFVFNKVRGNLAFDDLGITTIASVVKPLEGYTAKNVGDTDHYLVNLGTELPKSCYFTVKAVNADGKASMASDKRKVSLDNTSGIESPVFGESANAFTLSGLNLNYSGATDELVQVFNASGMLVGSARTDKDGNASIQLPASGLYVAATASGATKLLAR